MWRVVYSDAWESMTSRIGITLGVAIEAGAAVIALRMSAAKTLNVQTLWTVAAIVGMSLLYFVAWCAFRRLWPIRRWASKVLPRGDGSVRVTLTSLRRQDRLLVKCVIEGPRSISFQEGIPGQARSAPQGWQCSFAHPPPDDDDEPLPPGTYKVTWTVSSAEGHKAYRDSFTI